MTARLEALGLRKLYPSGDGLRGVDISVAAGEIHALAGLNGAGKSTLMRLMLGMMRADAGTVAIDGMRIGDAPASIWARVGQLIEYPLAYPELTVRQNLILAARLHGLDSAAAAKASRSVLSELNLSHYAERRTRQLSLGNRQRLGLASALQHDPDLLILDEPTNALDPAGVLLLRAALLRRAEAGAGILVSSHHLDEVARVADRITVINDGRLIGTLDPRGRQIERAFFALLEADVEASAA